MTNETKNRISAYIQELPYMKEKVFGALLMFAVAAVVVVSATYAWFALSRSPEISDITTTLAANGALELALAKPDGSMPDELDIDESLNGSPSVIVSNLQWGNLVNLSDPSYGIDNLALRPAQLNTTSLLNSPLWGAVYGEDGRITNLDSNYAYAKYNGSQFLTTNEYGVRAIATYKAEISDATQQAYTERVRAVMDAHTIVNQTYSAVAPKFSALGTMISKYAQDKLGDGYSNLAPYIANMIPLYNAVLETMEAQKTAYVELANLQSYLYANASGLSYAPLTWDNLYQNRTKYNTANATTPSADPSISLVGLTQFIKDYEQAQKDIEYLELYYADYRANGSAYYWGGYYVDGNGATVDDPSVSGYTLSNIVAHLVDYGSMTIDLENNGTEVKVTSLGMDQAGALLSANGNERKVYAHNGILYRLEQSSIDHEFRINGNAACTINVQYVISITVYGKAYTKASGACTFMENYTTSMGTTLVANDAVAQDTYGLAIDLWVRTNAEETCLTLEGATSTDEQGNIVSYDGINRIWGATGEAVLTTDSTTQGGGSCYVYYADTPEDMARSLDLLNSMKVAFVNSSGTLLATAEMDTVNYWAVNGRITVPLVLDNQNGITYTYTDEQNTEHIGYAITTLYTDAPMRVTAIVYLDGTRLTNDDVLAAAEIQGSLNIQFGSSTELKTRGDNELIDDTRSVTAQADNYSLDYDSAVTDEDLTTTVTLNVEGTQPEKITAFFVLAINSTQGTREETMTFEKQADGSWTHTHKFDAPGVYYLRHVRLDGVDYALHEPLEITVSGFALREVTWGLSGDSVTVRTSDNTYSVDVAAAFATTDTKKMPVSVQIRFVREDGNTVNVPLAYSSSSGRWTGTAQFSVSGNYTMEYIVYTIKGEEYGRYKDLGSFKKSMDLSLGMYVTVTDLSGRLEEKFDSDAAQQGVYAKNVAVRVYNNAGVEMEDLAGLRLVYSNGGSSTGTVGTNLTWDDVDHCYTGTLPITAAGRYLFANVAMGDQTLRVAKESPVYTIISPEPPAYDDTSATTVNNEKGVQLVPLTNDAVIDGLTVGYSSAANVSVVVYSHVAQKYFVLSNSAGTVVNSGSAGENDEKTVWTVKLPTYTLDLDEEGEPLEGATYTQEGGWSVAAVRISGCYDENGDFRNADNPIVWGGTDAIGRDYLTGEGLTADDSFDFSALSTTVSSSVKVTMVAGDTTLGSTDTDFMTSFNTGDLESYVIITDDDNNRIPRNKIGAVKLSISYTAPTTETYGYAVTSSANKDYVLSLSEYDDETGRYTVSGTDFWQYVGEYTVTGLTVEMVSGAKVPANKISGVPAMYTVTTAGPNKDDVTMTPEWKVSELGRTGTNVTGTFLQSHSLGNIRVKFGLTGIEDDINYVDMSKLVESVDLVLAYQSGKSAPNGGYSWSGTSSYENITMAMSNNGTGTYLAGSTSLLAGAYSARIVAVINGIEVTETMPGTISVYSKAPTLTVTGVNPATTKTFQMNSYSGNGKQYYDNAVLTTVQNFYTETMANVYIQAIEQTIEGLDSPLVDYTLPKVSLTLGDIGTTFAGATAAVTNNPESFSFTPSGLTSTVEIGTIGSDSFTYEASGTCGGDTVNVPFETQAVIGEQTVNSINVTDANGTVYTVSTSAVTIREKAEAPASISYVALDGYTTPEGQTSADGGALTVTLPTNIGTTTRDYEKTQEGAEWVQESSATDYLTFYKLKSCVQDQSYQAGGTCSSATPAKYTATFTYELYTRTTVVETLTSTTQTWRATEGVVGWIIDGQEYDPGETITVSGVVTATPKIGIISEVQLGNDKLSTLRRTTITDTLTEVRDVPKQATSSNSNTEAETTAKGYYTDCKPSGYNWFDNNDPTKDGHYVTPHVETLTVQ